MLAGCGGSGASETAANHDLEFEGGVEDVVPMPADATIQMVIDNDDSHAIMFRPNLTYTEFVEFYSERLSSNGWTITEERLPESAEGEREGDWTAEGHGTTIMVSFTAFGGPDSTMINGFLFVEK
ncbi:MAG: hypothetical protein LRY73_07320 [Bacillus sp. (in: Bacteria)]|nr:hypothetical protein [Bacillus sp. (in: firmicutes)]